MNRSISIFRVKSNVEFTTQVIYFPKEYGCTSQVHTVINGPCSDKGREDIFDHRQNEKKLPTSNKKIN